PPQPGPPVRPAAPGARAAIRDRRRPVERSFPPAEALPRRGRPTPEDRTRHRTPPHRTSRPTPRSPPEPRATTPPRPPEPWATAPPCPPEPATTPVTSLTARSRPKDREEDDTADLRRVAPQTQHRTARPGLHLHHAPHGQPGRAHAGHVRRPALRRLPRAAPRGALRPGPRPGAGHLPARLRADPRPLVVGDRPRTHPLPRRGHGGAPPRVPVARSPRADHPPLGRGRPQRQVRHRLEPPPRPHDGDHPGVLQLGVAR